MTVLSTNAEMVRSGFTLQVRQAESTLPSLITLLLAVLLQLANCIKGLVTFLGCLVYLMYSHWKITMIFMAGCTPFLFVLALFCLPAPIYPFSRVLQALCR